MVDEFTGGMYPDLVPNKIPSGSVSNLVNARALGDVITGRAGSIEMSSLVLPYEKTEIEFDRVGNEVTITSAHTFASTDKGYKLSDNSGVVMFIEQINTPTTLTISGNYDDATDASYTGYNLRGQINCSYANTSNSKQYYVIGRKLYVRIKLNAEWLEYTVVGNALTNSLSTIHEINNRVFLTNESGVYKLSDDVDNRIALQMNQPLPKFNINRSDKANMTNPSAYNYIYGFSSIDGDTRLSRRDSGAVIELETPPYLQVGKELNTVPIGDEVYSVDGQFKDYTTNFSSTPIDDAWYTRITINDTYKNPIAYSELSDGLYVPNFEITVNSETYVCYPNFSGVRNMTEVAERIEDALRQIDSGLSFRFGSIEDSGDSETLVFYCYHVLFYYAISIGSVSGVGFDMFVAGNNCLATNNIVAPMGHSLMWLRYPEDNYMITSYPVYRTKDILPHVEESPALTDPRLNNNPDTFALITDVPAAKLFTAEIDGTTGVMTITDGFDIGDSYNTIITTSGTTVIVSDPIRNAVTGITYQYNTDYTGANITSELMYIGAEDDVIVTKATNEITTAVGYTFSAADIGKVLFYSDGTTSYITDFVGGNIITADDVPKVAVTAVLNCVSRRYYDTASDVTQNGFLSTDQLNMRFYTPMERTSITGYSSGVLYACSDRESTIDYCDTARVYRIGYNLSTAQYIDSVLRNIVGTATVGDNQCFFTNLDTYALNTKQGNIITTAYGESYYVAPVPTKVSGSIGIRNRDSWSYSGKDEVVVYTSEPAIRRFNGTVYGDNIADGSVQRTFMKKLDNSVVLDYDTSFGLTMWGTIV
jgi:hypothetical protein